MKAITVEPMKPNSARLSDVPEPDPSYGSVLVEGVAVGVCGTDTEIAAGQYGWASPGRQRLTLGRVLDPGLSGLEKGDLSAIQKTSRLSYSSLVSNSLSRGPADI